ncbi:MAG: anti-sigma factor antagonist [Clostridia bacterium]|nr:anti-sigma factor antagonist [Clostridia bacterium]
MSAKLEYTRKEIRVYLDGEIDHHSASLIRTGIDDAVILRRPKLLVLDFSEVSFMDSSAIGLVMGRYKLMKTHGGEIRVEGLSPSAYKVMKLAGMEKLGEIRVKELV